MKTIYSIASMVLLFVACQPKPDNSAQIKFEENSKTVMSMLEAWQSESMDYSQYADNVVFKETAFNAEKDSYNLAEMKEHDIVMLKMFDFKLLEAPVLLPGVNPDTKEADGSVRYYGDWELTIPATDSTEAKSGVLSVYHSFDFDENGKIVYEQMYGDFTGLMMYFQTPSEPKAEEASE